MMNTDTCAASSAVATSQEPRVRHYTELLMLPFRVVSAAQPYEVKALSVQTLVKALETQAKVPGGEPPHPWRELPGGAVGVALPQGAKPLPEGFDAEAWQQHQALSYFHPTVRSFLFGSRRIAKASESNSPNDYLRIFRRPDIQRVRVTVWNGATKAEETRVFRVVRCDLALFQPDVGVLQLELQAEMDEGDGAGWPLSAVQRVRDELRRLYPPYLSDWPHWRGGHCPLAVGWSHQAAGESPQAWRSEALSGLSALAPLLSVEVAGQPGETPGLPKDAEALPVFGHWREWLGLDKVLEAKGWTWLPPGDERLPSMAFLALDNPRTVSRGDWVRLGLADAPGSDELPYARSALADFEKRFCYDRFWHEAADSTDSPSRIMNCGYAFTMVGAFADKDFFMNPRDGAWVTFRQIYARMGLVAHFQKAALLGALARLSALAWRQPDGKMSYDQAETHDKLTCFYEEFLEFTQIYWFDEVSPQAQGVELFEMWQRALRSKELYDEVRQELKDVVEYMNAEAAQRQADATERFTRVATVLGGLGVVAGLLGMNVLPNAVQLESSPWNGWAQGLAQAMNLTLPPWPEAWLLFGFAGLLVLVVGWVAFAGLPKKTFRRFRLALQRLGSK